MSTKDINASETQNAEASTTVDANKKRNTKGKGAQKTQEARFRDKKNKAFAAELKATLFNRLKISDPTNLSEIKLQSAIIPARVPVSLRGVPQLLNQLWARMVAIGTRPFTALATERNKAIFFRSCLVMFEVKVCYAQRKTEPRPPFDFSTQFEFTDLQLQKVCSIVSRLPFPLAIAVEALGNFTIDKQSIVPEFIKAHTDIFSGAVNFSITDIQKLVLALANPVPIDGDLYQVAQELSSLPGIDWAQPQKGLSHLTADAVLFWGGNDILPAEHRMVFLQIIASMESKKGFLLGVDLSTGDGTCVPVIRFPEQYDPDTDEALYYSNVEVPPSRYY